MFLAQRLNRVTQVGLLPAAPLSWVKHSTSEFQKAQVLKDVTIVDVKSTEPDAHFIGYFTGLSIEMLWYCVLIYWVGLDIIAIYEIFGKIYKSKSNTIWAIKWENDSLRKKIHYHRNRIVWFYRVMLLIFNSFYLTGLFQSWSEKGHIY